ncbi:MAG: hypothetical protein AAFX85_13735, partial [Pseudomonadota bacterium]
SAQEQARPTYLDGLGAYEVRALTGAIAPSNGFETIESVTPADWLNNDPGSTDVRSVISSWSGGGKSIVGLRLYLTGGGHGNSANNGIYIYDFAGDAQPTGWSVVGLSDLSAVLPEDNYTDGAPPSIHSYDGLVYAHHNGFFYRFGGAPWRPNGGFTRVVFKYDFTADEWIQLPSLPRPSPRIPVTVYDPASGRVLVGTERRNLFFFDTDTDTWGDEIELNDLDWPLDTTGAYDPTRRRAVLAGMDDSRLIDINFTTREVEVAALPATGETDILTIRAPAIFYDRKRDSFWLFGGETPDGPGWSHLYEMSAETFEVTRVALTGAAIEVASVHRGTYGRFVYMPEWRTIGMVADVDTPAYIIGLPPATRDDLTPDTPADLRAQ